MGNKEFPPIISLVFEELLHLVQNYRDLKLVENWLNFSNILVFCILWYFLLKSIRRYFDLFSIGIMREISFLKNFMCAGII